MVLVGWFICIDKKKRGSKQRVKESRVMAMDGICIDSEAEIDGSL